MDVIEDSDMDASAARLASLVPDTGAFDAVDVARLSRAGLSGYGAGVRRLLGRAHALFVVQCGELDTRWDPEDRLDATPDDLARETGFSVGRVKHLLELC